MSRDLRQIEKAFDKMSKDKKKKDKKEKRRKNKDLWTALAILSSVMILALAIAWLKSGESIVREIVGGTEEENRQIFETTRNVIFGAGFLSIIVVVIYIIKRLKYRKKPETGTAFIDYDRLDVAKARVAKAHMEKKSGEGAGRRNDDSLYEYEDTIDRKRPEGMSEAEYRAMRQREYQKYLSMDLTDDEDDDTDGFSYGNRDEDDDYEEMGLFESIKEYISEHKLISGIVAGAVAVTVIVTVILAIL